MRRIDEAARLEALRGYGVLDTAPEAAFDRLTALAADLFDAPMALVTLIDADRQWHKSAFGLERGETTREEAFCDHVVRGEPGGAMVVEDATLDPRFADNPFVTGDPDVRFYAGAALTTREGHNLGALCVIDRQARPEPDAKQLARLKILAGIVVDELELRKAGREMARRQTMLNLAESMAGVCTWRYHPASGALEWSDEVYRLYGVEKGVFVPGKDDGMRFYTPESRRRAQARIAEALAGRPGNHTEIFEVVRADGSHRLVASAVGCEFDEDGVLDALVGVVQDVTPREQALADAVAAREAAEEHARRADQAETVAGLGHWRLDAATGGIHWSAQMHAIYGLDPAQPLDLTAVLAMTHPDERQAGGIRIMQMLERGGVSDSLSRIYRSDGSLRWLRGRMTAERGADGKVVALMGTVMDVTEQQEAEAALADSETRYRTLAENTSDILIRFGRDGIIRYISPACRALGVDPETAVGQSVVTLVAPDHIERSAEIVAGLFTGAEVDGGVRRLHRIIGADDREVWLEGSPKLIRDETGEVAEVVTVLRDVTARQRMEQALADSEARYRVVTEAARDVILKYDLDGTIRYASSAARQMGYEPDALSGVNCADLVHPDDLPATTAQLIALHDRQVAAAPVEHRVRAADGTWVWVEGNPTLVRDAAGKALGYVNSLRDITARKTLQEALASSEARYRTLADAAPDMICETGLDYVVRYVSPAARAMLGVDPEALTGRYCFEGHSAEEEGAGLARLRAIVDSHGAAEIDPVVYKGRHADGSVVWIESRPAPLFDPAGAVCGFIDILRDITARKEMEQALETARAEAEAAAAVKGEFLANMSHELRTPLTSVLGFTRLALEQPDLSDATRGYIGRAAGAGSALLTTVNDILDFSKLEAGQVEIRPRPADAADVAQECLDLFSQSAGEKGLTLRLDADAALPSSLDFDPDRVRQLLINLVGNAVKFSETGEIVLAVGWRDGRLSMAVTDQGPGMSRADQALLFRRFSQVDGSSTRRHGGTGLGLAICKGLIEAMGGEIGVDSKVGRGARFHFTLPAKVSTPSEIVTGAPAVMPGTRVLAVDDHPVNLALVRAILSPFGCQVTEAEDGESAVALAEELPFDIILMDLRMPGLDGLAAVGAIRRGGGLNASTPILALSGDADAAGEPARRAAGFDGDLMKPVTPGALAAAVARHTSWEAFDDTEYDAA